MLETLGREANDPKSIRQPPLKDWLLTDLQDARLALQAGDANATATIHQIRRKLKRVRTLFLVMKSVAGTGHPHRDQPVRQAFQRLSGPRDADAMLKAANWLSDKADGKLRSAARLLVDRLADEAAALRAEQIPIAEIEHLLRLAETEAAAFAVDTDVIALLRRRLSKIYAKGRKLYHAARDAPDAEDETLHDWRKQVKHRLHIGQITEANGLSLGRFPMRDLDRLAEDLGEEHDFANLASWICRDAHFATAPKDLARLLAAITRRRAKLTARALELGAELYGEKVRRFAEGILH